MNLFGFCLYKCVKSLVQNQVVWNDFHSTTWACVDGMISIAHADHNNILARIKVMPEFSNTEKVLWSLCFHAVSVSVPLRSITNTGSS